MHCSSCAINIDFDLEDLSGIKSARTNYARQEAEIEYDAEVIEIEHIVRQIQRAGYKASLK